MIIVKSWPLRAITLIHYCFNFAVQASSKNLGCPIDLNITQASWQTDIKYSKTHLSPLDYTLQDSELHSLSRIISHSISLSPILHKVAMTLFAPIDASFLLLPIDMSDLTNKSIPPYSNHDYAKDILEYHVVAPRIIYPKMIEKGISLKTRGGQVISLRKEANSIIINNRTKVVEIVEANRGFIYKIENMLTRKWNDGPTLKDYIFSSPRLTKTRWLMERTGFLDDMAYGGPFTVLLIPDEGWKTRGNDIPQCFFDAIIRPYNKDKLYSFFKWLTIPGLWNSTSISSVNWLYNVENPLLKISHIVTPCSNDFCYHTFIEAMSIDVWDIHIYNGFAHVLSQMPSYGPMDISSFLWDCVDEFCNICPSITHSVLHFFDSAGLLPSPSEPDNFIVPDGSRPHWVCRSSDEWFPPGWNFKLWNRYIHMAKSGSNGSSGVAYKGAAEASKRLANLEKQLEKARRNRKMILDYQYRTNNKKVKDRHDASNIYNRLTNGRIEGWGNTRNKDEITKLPLKCAERRDITIRDLKYMARWA